jgi:hypothetical protein
LAIVGHFILHFGQQFSSIFYHLVNEVGQKRYNQLLGILFKIETHISGERVQSFQQTTLFPALRSKFKYEIVNQPRL